MPDVGTNALETVVTGKIRIAACAAASSLPMSQSQVHPDPGHGDLEGQAAGPGLPPRPPRRGESASPRSDRTAPSDEMPSP